MEPAILQRQFTWPCLVRRQPSVSPTSIKMDGSTLAAAISERDEVAILYGRGQLQFASPQSILVGDQPVSLKISDADGDGRDDIIVANRGDNTASVIFNRFDPTKVYRYDALAIDPDDDSGLLRVGGCTWWDDSRCGNRTNSVGTVRGTDWIRNWLRSPPVMDVAE